MRNRLKTLILALAMLALSAPMALAQSQPNNNGGSSATSPATDGCHAATVKFYVSLALSGVTTTKIATTTTGKSIQVCGIHFDMGGTTPSVQLIAGTGATCGTGSINLTGAMLKDKTVGYGDTAVYQVPIGLDLCAAQTGTTPTANGGFNYVLN